MTKLSVVIPIFNEEGNIVQLHKEINDVTQALLKKKEISGFEIIFVNDGSLDKSLPVLKKFQNKSKNIRRNRIFTGR